MKILEYLVELREELSNRINTRYDTFDLIYLNSHTKQYIMCSSSQLQLDRPRFIFLSHCYTEFSFAL